MFQIKKITIMIFIGLLGIVFNTDSNANCDMIAMLAKKNKLLTDFIPTPIPSVGDLNEAIYDEMIMLSPQNPYDFFVFLGEYSANDPLNKDGYGIVYYNTVLDIQRFYVTGFDTFYYKVIPNPYPNPNHRQQKLHDAYQAITDGNKSVTVVLGHDRYTSQGAYGSHPFWFEWEGKIYSIEHNGDCSILRQAMYNFLIQRDSTWFTVHPSNWGANTWSQFIDSELLFHFIMAHVIDQNGDVIDGIRMALNETSIEGYNFKLRFQNVMDILNFIISDGEALYIFRNTPSGDPINLEYTVFDNGFVAVKTEDSADTLYTKIAQHSLVYIPRDDSTCELPLDQDGVLTLFDIFSNTKVEEGEKRQVASSNMPETLQLRNYPNPFNISTNIQFSIPKSDFVTLKIYNLLGQEVATMVHEKLKEGSHTVSWNATGFASGVYLYRLQTERYTEIKKLVLIK